MPSVGLVGRRVRRFRDFACGELSPGDTSTARQTVQSEALGARTLSEVTVRLRSWQNCQRSASLTAGAPHYSADLRTRAIYASLAASRTARSVGARSARVSTGCTSAGSCLASRLGRSSTRRLPSGAPALPGLSLATASRNQRGQGVLCHGALDLPSASTRSRLRARPGCRIEHGALGAVLPVQMFPGISP
jgi:hypothetical protein